MTGKRQHIFPATIDFGSIAAQTAAEAVVQVGVDVIAAMVNPPDGFEANLSLSAYSVPARNEVQNVDNDATGGTFTLTFDSVESAPIAFDASAAALEAALEAISTINAVSVTLNGASDWAVEFQNPGFEDVGLLVADDTGLTGEITGTTIAETTKGRAKDTVIVRCANVSAGAIDPASQVYNIVCWI
jgi:hypothetical protein